MDKKNLRTSFGAVSSLYDSVRPDYPEALIADVIAISAIPAAGTILELGIGTGKATKPFLQRGYFLTALDISSKQITIAKKNLVEFQHIHYIVSSFETADLPLNTYDLVFAAQTFHWIDPSIRYQKSAAVLKPNGYLAIFSNFQCADAPLEKEIRKLYSKYCSASFSVSTYGTVDSVYDLFQSSLFFENVQKIRYLRDLSYSAKDYLSLLGTFSFISTLPNDQKELFFTDVRALLHGQEELVIPTESFLLIGRKR